MIYISIDVNGAPSPKEIKIGNQWENLDETIQFSFPENFSQLHKYAVACTYRKDTKERISRIFPLTDGRLVISSLITSLPGLWNIYTFCKSSEVDLDAKSIDLRAKNGEHISISDAITARVSANNIDIDSIKNVGMDPNIKIIYDDLFDFKIELENNEAARKTSESLRKQSEALRISAESERESAEQSRVEHENTRIDNEESRQSAERTRVSEENARVNAETLRKQSEASRAVAESKRVEAEKSRVSAEASRGTEENKRANAENLRKQVETARVNAETLRSQSEAARVESEKTRKNAETARAQVEQSRVNAEASRVSAETNRANAERQLAEAETSRINAEQSRSDAESLRVTAESKRATDTAASLKKIDDTVKKYSYIDECIDLQKAMGITVVDGCLCMYDDN